MSERVKRFLKNVNKYNACISIFAIIVSIITFFWTYSLQGKTLKFSTYNMDLSYNIKFSGKISRKDISLFEKHIQISSDEYISIIPKTGGIYKMYIVLPQPNFENDFDISIVNMENSDIATSREAQNLPYVIETINLAIFDEDFDNYYSSMIFMFEDYKHNLFSNLIVFEINKKDPANIKTRIYEETHLLFLSNEASDNIPKFDFSQPKRYSDFMGKIDELNI